MGVICECSILFSLHPIPLKCIKTSNPSSPPASDSFLFPLSGLILYSLLFVYLLSFCLRHFSLTSVFTGHEPVLSIIGGPQVLFSTWIDEGRICPWLTSVNTAVGLTPDLHRATDSLSSLSWKLSTEILAWYFKEI